MTLSLFPKTAHPKLQQKKISISSPRVVMLSISISVKCKTTDERDTIYNLVYSCSRPTHPYSKRSSEC